MESYLPCRLFLLMVISTWTVAVSSGLERPRYRTAYACEGSTLRIACEEGQLIHLIRANYGRFSIAICNENGHTEWSVNCMSERSFRVLNNECSQQRRCDVEANTAVFSDPCPGTFKYLEAHYQCVSASTTTTRRPRPPWPSTTSASVWSTTSTRPIPSIITSTTFPLPTTQGAVSPPLPKSSTPSDESQKRNKEDSDEVWFPEDYEVPDSTTSSTTTTTTTTMTSTTTSTTTTTTSTIASVQVEHTSATVHSVREDLFSHYCAPVTARNLYWNWTHSGERAVQPCPGGARGFAVWRCGRDPVEWKGQSPDLSECKSVWLTSLESRIEVGDSIVSISTELAQVTESKTLYGGDIRSATKILNRMADQMAHDMETFPDPQQREAIVTELLEGVVKTGSNLLENPSQTSWHDLSRRELTQAATSLLIGLEGNAFLLADSIYRQKTINKASKNIFVSVKVMSTYIMDRIQFPSEDSLGLWNSFENTISLPSEALLENSDNGLVRVVFFSYNNMEDLLKLPLPAVKAPIWSENVHAGRKYFEKKGKRIVNSKVISASLGKGRHIQLPAPVHVVFRHIYQENVSNPSCVFWDYTISSWSEEGCHVLETNYSHTSCECDHLTNFAILMDVHATTLSYSHTLALQVITYVGCIISVVCLILAVFVFHFFRELKSDRTIIHKNLCVCLLLAEVIFLAGIGQTDKPVVCGVVAGLLHYFFLCAFSWMFLEGFQLYVLLVEVFESERSRIKWYYAFAYGAPTIIVAVSCFVDPFSYGTESYCWLRADNFFIFSFVGPVIAVIIANLVFLSMAIYTMCHHAHLSNATKNKEASHLNTTSGKEENVIQAKLQFHLTWLRGAIILVFLLGLTWTFGLLYLNEESVIMAYVFTILNSLQGVFIFVFHCVQNEKVHNEYRKFVRRNPWLPACLSGTKSSSQKARHHSLYAGSNGTPSVPQIQSSASTQLTPQGTSYFHRMWSGHSSEGKTSSTGSGIPLTRTSQRASNRNTTMHPTDQEVENISFKSFSRDSGHGGSEQEDSPRSQTIAVNSLNNAKCLNNNRDMHCQPYIPNDFNSGMSNDLSVAECSVVDSDFVSEYCHDRLSVTHDIQQQQKQQGQNLKKRPTSSTSPLNHTYMEIDIQDGQRNEDDPVYEEIERNEIQVSDFSDEDVKRQSDVSRQSSRSCGDHKPLIPYHSNDRNLLNTINSALNPPQHVKLKHKQKIDPQHTGHMSNLRMDHIDPREECIGQVVAMTEDGRYFVTPQPAIATTLEPYAMDPHQRHFAYRDTYPYPSDSAMAMLNKDGVVCQFQPEDNMPQECQVHLTPRTKYCVPYSEI